MGTLADIAGRGETLGRVGIRMVAKREGVMQRQRERVCVFFMGEGDPSS